MAISFRSATSYGSSASALTHDIPYPTLLADDVLFLPIANNVDNTPPSTPSGWSIATQISEVARSSSLYYKVATGSESGSLTLSWAAAVNAQGGMLSFSGVDNTTPLDVSGLVESQSTSVTHTQPTITPVNNGTYLLHIFTAGNATTWGAPTTGTEEWEATASAVPRSTMAVHRVGPAAGVGSSTISANLSATGVAVLHTIALREAGAAVSVVMDLAELSVAGLNANVGWSTRTPPDSILEMHKLSGALSAIQDDPDSPDANWHTYS
jgi:hypothetical protein